MLLIDGHELIAQRIVGRMQTHRKRHGHRFAQLIHLAHKARGGNRHAAARKPVAVVVQKNSQGRNDVIEVLQGLAHPHQHNIADHAVVGVGNAGFAP